MRKLRFDVTRLRTSFAAYKKCGTVSANYTSRQTRAGLDQKGKRYVKDKRIKERRSTVFHLSLTFSAFLFFFLSVYIPGTINSPK